MIDRRLNELWNVSVDREFCARVRQLELDLKVTARRLENLQCALPHIRQQTLELRARITEFLDQPNGRLTSAIRTWPPLDSAGNGQLEQAVTDGSGLHHEACAFVEFVDEFLALRLQADRMQSEFEPVLPVYWASAGVPLIEYLGGIRSPAGLKGMQSQVGATRDSLRAHLDALTRLRNDLLSGGRVHLDEEAAVEIGSMTDLERAVDRLVERAEIHGQRTRSASIALADAQVEAHLRHSGLRRPDIAVRHKPLGSPQRAMARWKQLHRVAGD